MRSGDEEMNMGHAVTEKWAACVHACEVRGSSGVGIPSYWESSVFVWVNEPAKFEK